MNSDVSDVVPQYFNETSKYKNRKGLRNPEDKIALDYLLSRCNNTSRVLEVGGGSGAFLDIVLQNTSVDRAVNCEIAAEAYREQANSQIILVEGSVLNLPFENESFDWIVMKNVLHHLVGETVDDSKRNVERALSELSRVKSEKGHVVIIEQYNKYRPFSMMIFYLTKFLSMAGIGLNFFECEKNVIVSFLTPLEIITWTKKIFSKSEIEYEIRPLAVRRRFKYTLLMSKVGNVVAFISPSNQ